MKTKNTLLIIGLLVCANASADLIPLASIAGADASEKAFYAKYLKREVADSSIPKEMLINHYFKHEESFRSTKYYDEFVAKTTKQLFPNGKPTAPAEYNLKDDTAYAEWVKAQGAVDQADRTIEAAVEAERQRLIAEYQRAESSAIRNSVDKWTD